MHAGRQAGRDIYMHTCTVCVCIYIYIYTYTYTYTYTYMNASTQELKQQRQSQYIPNNEQQPLKFSNPSKFRISQNFQEMIGCQIQKHKDPHNITRNGTENSKKNASGLWIMSLIHILPNP